MDREPGRAKRLLVAGVIAVCTAGCASNPPTDTKSGQPPSESDGTAGAVIGGAAGATLGAIGGTAVGAVGAVAVCAPLSYLAIFCAPIGAAVGLVGGAVKYGQKGAEWGRSAGQSTVVDVRTPSASELDGLPAQATRIDPEEANLGRYVGALVEANEPVGGAPSTETALDRYVAQVGRSTSTPPAPVPSENSLAVAAASIGADARRSTLDADGAAAAMITERFASAPSENSLAVAAASIVAEDGRGGLPAPGTQWTYRFTDQQYGRRTREYSVSLRRADELIVEEIRMPNDSTVTRVMIPTDARIYSIALDRGAQLTEYAPYLSFGKEGADSLPDEVPGYPAGQLGPWIAQADSQRWDEVSVPAGRFRALRIQLSGKLVRPSFAYGQSGRFELVVWYAPAAKRIVRLEHKTWDTSGSPKRNGHDVVELISFQSGQ